MGESRRRTDTQAETRAAILDAAWHEFTTRRFDKVSLDAVAAKAGYTKGAIYSNFQSKRDLLFHVLEHRTANVGADYVEATFADDVAAIGDGVAARADRTSQESAAYFRLLAVVWAEAMYDEAFADRFAELRKAHRRRIAAAIIDRAADVGIDVRSAADDMATGIIAMSWGTFFESALDADISTAAVHRTMIDLVVAGVLAGGTAPPAD